MIVSGNDAKLTLHESVSEPEVFTVNIAHIALAGGTPAYPGHVEEAYTFVIAEPTERAS